MIGRTPGNIIAVRPLLDGVITDSDVTQIMLKYFILKFMIGKVLEPMVIGVPSGITGVERRAVIEAASFRRSREAHLIEEPMAAAIGANYLDGENQLEVWSLILVEGLLKLQLFLWWYQYQ